MPFDKITIEKVRTTIAELKVGLGIIMRSDHYKNIIFDAQLAKKLRESEQYNAFVLSLQNSLELTQLELKEAEENLQHLEQKKLDPKTEEKKVYEAKKLLLFGRMGDHLKINTGSLISDAVEREGNNELKKLDHLETVKNGIANLKQKIKNIEVAMVDYDNALEIHESILPDLLILGMMHDTITAVCQRTTLGFMANNLIENFYQKTEQTELNANDIFLLAVCKWYQVINNFDSAALRCLNPNKLPVDLAVARGRMAMQGFFIADKFGGAKKEDDDIETYNEVFTASFPSIIDGQLKIKEAIGKFLEEMKLNASIRDDLTSTFNKADGELIKLISTEEKLKIHDQTVGDMHIDKGSLADAKLVERFTFVR